MYTNLVSVYNKYYSFPIIDINYNSLDFESLKEYHKLNYYIEQRYKKGMNNFVLIDEVQMCEGFEKTINSLHAELKINDTTHEIFGNEQEEKDNKSLYKNSPEGC